MTTNDPADPEADLSDDEILVYLGPSRSTSDGDDVSDPFEQQAIFRRKSLDAGLEKVKISDDELNRLRNQVKRIASKLEGEDGTSGAHGFFVDTVSLHIGINASGQFFFIASAGVEAAVDVTWKHR